MNKNPIEIIAVNPALAKYTGEYKKFFKKEGFVFDLFCKEIVDKSLLDDSVYFIHEDKSLTAIKVK